MAQGIDRSPRAILDELTTHPHGAALAELVHMLGVSAFDERRSVLDHGLDEATSRVGVDEVAAETSFGNVLRALRKRDAATAEERTLLGALIAKGVAGSAPSTPDAQRRVAEALAWLSSHTVADPLACVDAALADGFVKDGLYEALGALVREHVEGRHGSVDRPSALLASIAIGRSNADGAARVRGELAVTVQDTTIVALVGPATARGPASPQLVVSGEETAAPRGSLATLLLTVTFILPLLGLAKLFGRFALRLRRPAEVAFSKEGVTVRSRVEVLGKIVRERETFLATGNLVRAAREVRYPRLATYVGITCLLVGSYLGLRHVLDGIRAGSPEFLALGIGILVVSLAIDYALSLLPARSSDRCRIVLEPRRGRVVAVAQVDKTKAEAALQTLKA
ncbi:MAG: hypothetical protein HOW73_10810 [Polyangiaceae bacterium]|nr:hypothetical protein [Polyangiaceae bacterium]